MSVNNQRQALTRERVLPPGANQSLEFGHHYPYDRCRSSTIATIIQHSAENLHENTHQESHIVRVEASYLTVFRDLVSFLV
jgi:hypothetical protein